MLPLLMCLILGKLTDDFMVPYQSSVILGKLPNFSVLPFMSCEILWNYLTSICFHFCAMLLTCCDPQITFSCILSHPPPGPTPSAQSPCRNNCREKENEERSQNDTKMPICFQPEHLYFLILYGLLALCITNFHSLGTVTQVSFQRSLVP